jgi:hypothetical protein
MQKIDEASGSTMQKIGNLGEKVSDQTANFVGSIQKKEEPVVENIPPVAEGATQQPVVVSLDSLTTPETPTPSISPSILPDAPTIPAPSEISPTSTIPSPSVVPTETPSVPLATEVPITPTPPVANAA